MLLISTKRDGESTTEEEASYETRKDERSSEENANSTDCTRKLLSERQDQNSICLFKIQNLINLLTSSETIQLPFSKHLGNF